MEGIFTISLDFELHWGVFDKRDRQSRESCYRNTLKLVPQMLELFAKYNVHVTWATVGSMFADNQDEWELYKPAVLPDFVQNKYSAYQWAEKNGMPDQYSWAHFAPEEILSILQFPGQELGTHTFSHYYCTEQNREKESFRYDLQAAKKIASKFNSNPVSLIFPRNKFDKEHIKTCFEVGIKVVRRNPDPWFKQPAQNIGSKLLHTLVNKTDDYLRLGKWRSSYSLKDISVNTGEPIILPSSRFFYPWQQGKNFANKLRLKRMIQELESAAMHKECYHLWWHPENFGDHPEQNLQDLKILLEHYKKCREQYGMKSWNMGEYAMHLIPTRKNVLERAAI
ncbi:MAG: polysaccharide deacetylase family protein [Chitinophagaceae bacterium]|nr:polysaccharide deacetylase family protein [Chitinophagaceae bacterium]